MQQHSGQHLLSAVLEKQYDTQVSQEVTQYTRINSNRTIVCFQTLSWWMAEHTEAKVGVSYIEVNRAVSEEDLAAVQERCNEVIRAALPVTVNTFEVGDPELDQVRHVTCTAACHTAATCPGPHAGAAQRPRGPGARGLHPRRGHEPLLRHPRGRHQPAADAAPHGARVQGIGCKLVLRLPKHFSNRKTRTTSTSWWAAGCPPTSRLVSRRRDL